MAASRAKRPSMLTTIYMFLILNWVNPDKQNWPRSAASKPCTWQKVMWQITTACVLFDWHHLPRTPGDHCTWRRAWQSYSSHDSSQETDIPAGRVGSTHFLFYPQEASADAIAAYSPWGRWQSWMEIVTPYSRQMNTCFPMEYRRRVVLGKLCGWRCCLLALLAGRVIIITLCTVQYLYTPHNGVLSLSLCVCVCVMQCTWLVLRDGVFRRMHAASSVCLSNCC